MKQITVFSQLIMIVGCIYASLIQNQQTFKNNEFSTESPRISVAVIGAGSAGASTVYYLNSYSKLFDVTVFEASDRIGGRAHAIKVPVNNSFVTIEMGASIIAQTNTHLLNATLALGLQNVSSDWNELIPDGVDPESIDGGIGIWNGEKFVFIQKPGKGWMDRWVSNVKLLWRYGFLNGPVKAMKLVDAPVQKYLKLYDKMNSGAIYSSVSSIVNAVDLWDTLGISAYTFFREVNKISEAFVREFIGGVTIVTYSQEVDEIVSLGAMISMYSANTALFKVKGGNSRLFEEMITSAKPTVLLNSRVDSVNRVVSSSNRTTYLLTTNGVTQEFDVVVIAAPLTGSINFDNVDTSVIEPISYINLHVTVVVGSLSSTYFNLPVDKIPHTIMVPSYNRTSPFTSFSIYHSANGTQVVKIFSLQKMKKASLSQIFTEIQFLRRVVWDKPGPYPYLNVKGKEWKGQIEIADGLYYVNAMEGFLSTMETESVAGRNVANLILKRY
ncbi:hypothetical protein HK096_002390 [Nowakowskiella sp. JEL0078]|nr:hypothetical protein HK096_002390 [Nowakowskiella sp. JEL0078]